MIVREVNDDECTRRNIHVLSEKRVVETERVEVEISFEMGIFCSGFHQIHFHFPVK
jgi:hypothetical protein